MQRHRPFTIKLLYIGSISLLAVLPSFADGLTDQYKRLENSLTINNSSQKYHDLSWITPTIRSELIGYAYSKLDDPATANFLSPKDALFWLGDSGTIHNQVKAYRESDGRGSLIGPPDILPYLVYDLTNGSPVNHNDLGYSPMDKSVLCALETIAGWPAFPEPTKKWAQALRADFGLGARGPNAPENHLIREWWEHNKKAVLSRRYIDATWLPTTTD